MRGHKSGLVSGFGMDFMDSGHPKSFLVHFQNARGIWSNIGLEKAERTNWMFFEVQYLIILLNIDPRREEGKVFALAPTFAFLEKIRRPRLPVGFPKSRQTDMKYIPIKYSNCR